MKSSSIGNTPLVWNSFDSRLPVCFSESSLTNVMRRGIGIVLLVAVVLGGGLLWKEILCKPPVANPVYGGKTAEEWFYGPTGNPGLQSTILEARRAFSDMGTNCIPFLLEKAKMPDSFFNRLFCRLLPELPKGLQVRLGPAVRRPYIQTIAYVHLHDQVMNSGVMVEEILASVQAVKDDQTRQQALLQMRDLIPWLHDKSKEKAYYLSFLDDTDFQIQIDSAVKLSQLEPSLTNGVPILLKAYTNNSYLAYSITSRWPARLAPLLSTGLPGQLQFYQHAIEDALKATAPRILEEYPLKK